jgi:hypothetical protein
MANVETIKKKYTPGTRIQLEEMAGESDMPCGLTGSVRCVDDIGQIHVDWDNGRTLAINTEVDIFKIIK